MRMRAGSPSSNARPGRRATAGPRALPALAAVALAAACDQGGPSAAPAAVIVSQPEDQAVFEGQTALFQVFASGTDGLTYQWRRDGTPIPGATDSHFVTPSTVPGDDGATYSVSVTNAGADPVESRAARLTVLPPLDLRFQWVGAPFTPSYRAATNFIAPGSVTYRGTGSPLLMGSGSCASLLSCSLFFVVDPTVRGMTITYQGGPLADFGAGWASAHPHDTIVSSLDLEGGAYAVSLSQTTQAGEFTPVVQGSVALDQLQATASSEGASGRVLTALSFQGGLVSYVSYGWSRDTSTVYEAQVVATTFDAVAAEAASLAAQGYAITAFGAGNNAANGLLLVGTRVQGNATPRGLKIVSPIDLAALEGCAIVGYLFDAGAGTLAMIAEQ
jgi:hypothetical protein